IEESGLVDMTGSESGEKYWRLNLERGGEERSIRCRFLVLAIGDMHRPRKLGIPGEEQSNVSHYLRELRNYFRQEVVIVGGRNSAVEAAIRIFRMGGKVTLLYRGKGLDGKTIKYWLYPEIESMIKNGLIRFIPEATAHQIRGNRLYYSSPGSSRDVEGTYQAAGDGNQGSFSHKSPPGKSDSDSPGDEPVRPDAKMQELEADQFLLLTGYEQDYSFLESLGLQLEGAEKRPFFDNNTMETNLSNVFIAGTATAGSQQRHTVFIENSHEHVSRIGHTILGRKPQGDGRSRSDSSAFAIQPSPGSGLFPNDIPGEGNEPGSGDALKRIYEEHPES
ncbi:MAG: NAD(P)-binding domain-containing protein, partial [Leptospiraceae bacterium]|nr:NAD(P)-binding domain-containing protein [Leptospiraceae bacterium]